MLRVAMWATSVAGGLCREMQAGIVTGVRAGGGEHKADGSDVTVADYASQALLVHLLASRVEMPCVVAEESAAALAARPDLLAAVTGALERSGLWKNASAEDVLEALLFRAWDGRGAAGAGERGRYWTIDPIDGTKGYATGRQFAVCVALIENGRAVLAVLACPNLPLAGAAALLTGAGEEAGLGGGMSPVGGGTTIGCVADGPVVQCACDGSAGDERGWQAVGVRVAEVGRPAVFTFAVEPSEGRVLDLARIGAGLIELGGSGGRGGLDALSGLGAPTGLGMPLSCDSQAKYALVARGDADVYYRPPRRNSEKVWDHAAGCLILERAGCVVTDVRGRGLDWREPVLSRTSGVLGAPAGLHARVLRVLGGASGGPADGK